MVQQQLQDSEPMVSTEGISSLVLDNDPMNICEPNPDDLPIALSKEKRTFTKYPISQFVSSKHLSLQHQTFIVAIDSIQIPTQYRKH